MKPNLEELKIDKKTERNKTNIPKTEGSVWVPLNFTNIMILPIEFNII